MNDETIEFRDKVVGVKTAQGRSIQSAIKGSIELAKKYEIIVLLEHNGTMITIHSNSDPDERLAEWYKRRMK